MKGKKARRILTGVLKRYHSYFYASLDWHFNFIAATHEGRNTKLTKQSQGCGKTISNIVHIFTLLSRSNMSDIYFHLIVNITCFSYINLLLIEYTYISDFPCLYGSFYETLNQKSDSHLAIKQKFRSKNVQNSIQKQLLLLRPRNPT